MFPSFFCERVVGRRWRHLSISRMYGKNTFTERNAAPVYTTSAHSFTKQQWGQKRIHHANNLWVMKISTYSIVHRCKLANQSLTLSLALYLSISRSLFLSRSLARLLFFDESDEYGKEKSTSQVIITDRKLCSGLFGKKDDYFTIPLLCCCRQWNRTNEHQQ